MKLGRMGIASFGAGIMILTAGTAALAQKNSDVRYFTYNSATVVEGVIAAKAQIPGVEDGVAALKSTQAQLNSLAPKVADLVSAETQPAQLETKCTQLIDTESKSLDPMMLTAILKSRSSLSQMNADILKMVGTSADIVIPEDAPWFGGDKLKTSADISQQVISHYKAPSETAKLPEPTKQPLKIGGFVWERVQKCPLFLQSNTEVVKTTVKGTVNALVYAMQFDLAKKKGLPDDKLEALATETNNKVESERKTSQDKLTEIKKQDEEILRQAIEQVAKKNNLDIVVSLDLVSVDPNFQKNSTLDITDQVIAAVTEKSKSKTQ